MAERLEIHISTDARKAESEVSSLTKTFSVLGNVAATVAKVGLVAAGIGVAALATGLTLVIKEAAEAQEIQAQLNAVLQSTGGIAGVTAEEVNGLAAALQRTTRFSDDMVVSGENILLTFTNIGSNIFPQATQTMLDMSQALGQDLQSSAIQLGKALQDPILGVTALRRVGVNFNESQQELITSLVESGNLLEAQNMILRELQTEFGGSAVAAGQTFAGQLDILKNSAAELAETLGIGLLGILDGPLGTAFTGISNVVNDLSDRFNQFFTNVDAGMSPVQAFRYAFESIIPPGFQGLFNAILDGFRELELVLADPEVQSALREVGSALLEMFNQNMQANITDLTSLIRAFSNTILHSGPAIIAVLNAVADVLKIVNQNFDNLRAGQAVLGLLGVPGFAGGVSGFRGGYAMVGERGPEMVKLPAGSSVYNTTSSPFNNYGHMNFNVNSQATFGSLARQARTAAGPG